MKKEENKILNFNNRRSGGMVDTTDSKSVTGNSVGVQVPSPAPSSSDSEEYNPLEWAKIMVEAKTIYGEPTTLSKEYEAIVK